MSERDIKPVKVYTQDGDVVETWYPKEKKLSLKEQIEIFEKMYKEAKEKRNESRTDIKVR